MRKWTIALVFIVLSGCGGADRSWETPEDLQFFNWRPKQSACTKKVYMDPMFDRWALEEAVSYWNWFFQTAVLEISENPIEDGLPGMNIVLALDRDNGGRADSLNADSTPAYPCTIYVAEDEPYVVTHEIGHCLGFNHTNRAEETNDPLFKEKAREFYLFGCLP